jgi:hypothetical protein
VRFAYGKDISMSYINLDETDLVRAIMLLVLGFEGVCDESAKIRTGEADLQRGSGVCKFCSHALTIVTVATG